MNENKLIETQLASDSEEGSPYEHAGIIGGLAALPEKALVPERELAAIFYVSQRTIQRMVGRNELPPPVRLGGKSMWIVGRVLAHIEGTAENAERVVRRAQDKLAKQQL
jgi:predicted DNA-binding transcriptional regulator AlpA